MKCTSGEAFFLGDRLITWLRKKQSYILQSTTEAQYVATTINFSNVVCIKKLLEGIQEEVTNLVTIYF